MQGIADKTQNFLTEENTPKQQACIVGGLDVTFLTPKEVAEMLKLQPATVYEYIKAGKLPALRFGNRYRIAKEDLDAFLARARKGDLAEPGEDVKEIPPDAREE